MVNIRSLLISSILLVTIAACQNYTVDSPHLLTDQDCEPPCWNQITPGKTTALEAEAILQNSGFVAEDSIFQQDLTGYEEPVLRWKFKGRGEGLIFVQNGLVLVTEINASSSAGIGVTLSKMIEAYGEPDNVFSAFNPDIPQWGWISFLYPDKGMDMVYAARLERAKYRTILRPETPISEIKYFSPDAYPRLVKTYLLANSDWSQKEIDSSTYSWKGYGIISDKYPTAFGKK